VFFIPFASRLLYHTRSSFGMDLYVGTVLEIVDCYWASCMKEDKSMKDA
jgi:hypothetical protein